MGRSRKSATHQNPPAEESQPENVILSDTAESPPQKRSRVAARGPASYARKRAVTACQVCRARRTKCDNKTPSCSFCEKIGAECIREAVQDYSSFDPASLKILERLGRIETLLETKPTTTATTTTSPAVPVCTPSPYTATSTTHTGTQRPDSVFRTLCLTSAEVLSWPAFKGEFEHNARTIGTLRRTPPVPPPRSTSLVDAVLDNMRWSNILIEKFIQFVHIKNPILEIQNVTRAARHARLEGLGWDPDSCLLLLVWALGAVSSRFIPEPDDGPYMNPDLELGAALFAAATKRMGCVFLQGDVLAAQCSFYSGVYLMTIFQPHAAWRYFLQALACCQELDFAIKSTQEPELLHGTSPIEHRLYWTCWKSEVELRMHIGPLDFKLQDRVYPAHLPSPPADPERNDRAWFFYLAEISLRRLNTTARNEIGQILSQGDSSCLFTSLKTSAESYIGQLDAWIESLPDTIRLYTENDCEDILTFILRCHVANFTEQIYWPFIGVCGTTPVVGEMAEMSKRALDNCVDRIEVAYHGYKHRHHGTWMLMQSCIRSALVLLSAAYTMHGKTLLPEGGLRCVNYVLDMLRFWSGEDETIRTQKEILQDVMTGLGHYPSSSQRLTISS